MDVLEEFIGGLLVTNTGNETEKVFRGDSVRRFDVLEFLITLATSKKVFRHNLRSSYLKWEDLGGIW